uniref:Electron transfer flavoprotein subunit beta/FixA family protein n=1 Tax=Thermomicrobium roseum TaxID=500 RepID=A0A7C2BF40_THERO
MTIVVVMEQVPDVVEELAIAPSGTDLDRDAVSYVVNEYDDHALEEALLLAEATGDEVVAVGIDTTGELDQALYTALAKGARRAIKLTGDFEGTWLSTRAAARLLVPVIQELEPRLVLTGVQAPDDLDGQLAPTLAALLGWPHASVVIGSQLVDGALQVRKELWGGMTMTLELELPAVLGVQAARQAPRYVPISRVRQVMREATIETRDVETSGDLAPAIMRLRFPEEAGQAEILTGSASEIADRIIELLRARGLL